MALPNLTRDQAAERAALVTVDNYRIDLDLTDGAGAPGERTFRSVTTVTFSALPGANTVIDIAADTIRSATLNGLPIDVSAYDESTGVPLAGLAEQNVVVVDADCRYSNTGEGLHRFVDPVDGEVYLYSQFETADAKRMFACFDQPDLKATFDVTVTAPAHWQVISNGAGTATGDGKHTFATTPKMSTYLKSGAQPGSLQADITIERKDIFPLRRGQTGRLAHARPRVGRQTDDLNLRTKSGNRFRVGYKRLKRTVVHHNDLARPHRPTRGMAQKLGGQTAVVVSVSTQGKIRGNRCVCVHNARKGTP